MTLETVTVDNINYAQSTLKDVLSKENKMLKRFPEIIQELVKNDFPISFTIENGLFTVGDFYKTGDLKLALDDDDRVIAFDKEGNKGEITNIEQVVKLNFYWWLASQTKAGYPQLTKHWTDEFLKRKWLKVVRVYVPDIDAYSETASSSSSSNSSTTSIDSNKIDSEEQNNNLNNVDISKIEIKQEKNQERDEEELSLEELEKLTNPSDELNF